MTQRPHTAESAGARDELKTPEVTVRQAQDGSGAAVLSGHWTLRGLRRSLHRVHDALQRHAGDPALEWDLREVDALDSTGALILWRTWGRALPGRLRLPDRYRPLFEFWLRQGSDGPAPRFRRPALHLRMLAALASPAKGAVDHVGGSLLVLGQLCIDALDLLRRPARIPWREISATVYLAGFRALPITGLVGVLIGVVVAYQSGLQLRSYGAETFIVDMLGFSITRELGPILAAIIVAGRSGSSMTAQIGVMRLTQELDAMTTLGMSVTQRLILPQVLALTLVLPLLALWTITAAMAGGIVASQLTVGLGWVHFIEYLPQRMPVANLWIGMGKSAVFGGLIGLTSAHFGLRIKPNTRSLGLETTRAVVASITLVIVLNALFSILLRDVGF